MNVLNQEKGENWQLYHGDCVEVMKGIPDNSIDFSVSSPPFASLYTYSDSDRDMGNTKDDADFMVQYRFMVEQMFRVIRPGRNVSFHCMNLPTSKEKNGYIGIRDFRGELIKLYQECGFIYHSEVCIWKDPVTAMQRTKALGLLHKQVVKDSTMSRQGIPDYLVTMRKPGVNTKPVSGEFDHYVGDEEFHSNGRLSIDVWQRYASPVWMDINPSDTLQYRSARDDKDGRHICPLQLSVIHRALQLWSMPGDIVLSPFSGIASEGWESLKLGRKYVGIELKESYFKQGVKNMIEVEKLATSGQLKFDE
jgi:DNA modification methylase